MVDIRVGESHSKRWLVHKRLICQHSLLLSQALTNTLDERSLVWHLPNDHPAGFELFLEWLYMPTIKQSPPLNAYSTIGTKRSSWVPNRDSKWRLYASEAYFIGDALQCETFKQYSLSKILSSIHEYDQSDFEYIFDRLEGSSRSTPLALLAHHWIKWREFHSRGIWKQPLSKRFLSDLAAQHMMRNFDSRDISFWHWFDCSTNPYGGLCAKHSPKRVSKRDLSLNFPTSLYRTYHRWNDRRKNHGLVNAPKSMKVAWEERQGREAEE
jgi:hypothetical protein